MAKAFEDDDDSNSQNSTNISSRSNNLNNISNINNTSDRYRINLITVIIMEWIFVLTLIVVVVEIIYCYKEVYQGKWTVEHKIPMVIMVLIAIKIFLNILLGVAIYNDKRILFKIWILIDIVICFGLIIFILTVFKTYVNAHLRDSDRTWLRLSSIGLTFYKFYSIMVILHYAERGNPY